MCNFLSAVILRSPKHKKGYEFVYNDATSSHSDLLSWKNIRDRPSEEDFARVEYTPTELLTGFPDFTKLDEYRFRLDQDRRPEFFTTEIEALVVEDAKKILSTRVAVTDQYLLGGRWLIPEGVEGVNVGPNTVVQENRGKIRSNFGRVLLNSGRIVYNEGVVKLNTKPGKIDDVTGDGLVVNNEGSIYCSWGLVQNNRVDGVIEKNNGVLRRNTGSLEQNAGYVLADYSRFPTGNKGVLISGYHIEAIQHYEFRRPQPAKPTEE